MVCVWGRVGVGGGGAINNAAVTLLHFIVIPLHIPARLVVINIPLLQETFRM